MAQKQLKATLEVDYIEEEEESSSEGYKNCIIYEKPIFYIKFVTSYGLTIKIHIEEPYLSTFDQWRKLSNGKSVNMGFSMSYDVSIKIKNNIVYFNVGAGGDGHISIRVPHSDIKEILSEMADEIEIYEKQYE